MGCIGSRVALFRSCSFTSGSHSGSLTSSSGGIGAIGAVGGGVGGSVDATGQRSSRRQNIFSVQNVDDTGQGVSPGKLEVTETDLVLHVKGKLPLTWPLRSLRRYGFDNDLFSFESGRRCSTGAGIFAFRCHRAQSLFNLLQSKVQQAGGQGGSSGGGVVLAATSASLPTLPSTPITPTNTGTPINTTGGGGPPMSATSVTTPVGSTFVYVNLSESSSTRVVSSGMAPPIPPPASSSTCNNIGGSGSTAAAETNPDVQTPGASHTTPAVSSVSLPSSSRGPLLLSSCKPSLENHPVYMNVDSHGGALYAASTTTSTSTNITNYSNIPPPTAPRRVSTSSMDKTHHHYPPQPASSGPSSSSSCSLLTSGGGGSASQKALPDCALYSNVFCNHGNKGTIPVAGIQTTTGGVVLPLPVVKQEPAELNYAELDLKPDSSSSQNSPFSSGSRRLGLFNKHHQLISTYSKQAEPYDTSRLASISDDVLEADKLLPTASNGPADEGAASSVTPEQKQSELGYATIDFDKTAQLNVITRSKLSLTFDEEDSPSKKGGSSLVKKLKYGTTGL